MRILAVDPNRAFHQLLKSQLQPIGCELTSCSNGYETLKALNSNQYDLITLARYIQPDDYLPLLKHIRSLPKYQFTPVMLVSYDYDFNFVKEAVGHGITDVLDRHQPDQLIDGIIRLLRRTSYQFDDNVLLVEDSPTNGQLVTTMLQQRGMSVEWHTTYSGAIDALEYKEFDLIITDLLLDEKHTGLELLHYIRHHTRTTISDLPVIALTGFNDPSRRLLAFHLGADDFVSKPFSEEELLVRIDRVLSRHKLVTQLQKREAQLTEMALFDSLTSVYNRHGLSELMKKRIRYCHRHEIPAVMLLIDLDHFKELNDTFGHPFGDTVLRKVGQTLNDIVRDDDIAGRWGGDEFLVFLPHCQLAGATQTARRIRNRLQQHNERIGCSIGISQLTPEDTLESLIEHADKALYKAKAHNKGGYAHA